ncbi:pseudouridine synthase [Synechococcus elongatus IITB4]|uniref:pseudouridine synthase n=1 Tax=Synechococcus elongatus TaxID=32046 RepID=UPI0030D59D14
MAYRYLLFHKPYDVLCQFSPGDCPEQQTLKDYIDVPEVYPVGRLDRDSEGLLLLTNNGALQHRLCHPRFGHDRTYWVQVEREPSEEALTTLRKGVQIQDYRTRPAKVQRLVDPHILDRDPPIRFRKTVPTAWLAITLQEGRNRQVRRMTAAVGHPTLRLIRVAIATHPDQPPLQLQGLAPGRWRDLTAVERRRLESLLRQA